MNRTKRVAVPGEAIAPEDTQSNPDEAIEFARTGQARPIKKLRAVVPEAVLDRPDPDRPPEAFVNASQYDMDMNDALDLDNRGELPRSVLTEQGWYCPQNTMKQRLERKKNNQAEFVILRLED